jgi:hypothetical protein
MRFQLGDPTVGDIESSGESIVVLGRSSGFIIRVIATQFEPIGKAVIRVEIITFFFRLTMSKTSRFGFGFMISVLGG